MRYDVKTCYQNVGAAIHSEALDASKHACIAVQLTILCELVTHGAY